MSGRGYLSTRPGSTALYPNYAGSCLKAAGSTARVRSFQEPLGSGFVLSTTIAGSPATVQPTVPGDWFILDYRAEQVGSCDVGLYNLDVSYDMPMQTLSFRHVPSRDFNGDTVVDFRDFALLTSRWGWRTVADTPDAAFDLNTDGRIDTGDLALFSEYWLERTDYPPPAADPNTPPAGNL